MVEIKFKPSEKKGSEKEKSKNLPTFFRSVGLFFLETLKVIVISLIIIIPIRYFLVQPFYVRGASMEPTLEDYEYLIIDEISYRFSEPNRGDIIVLKDPQDSSQYFIKRIIGLPGEEIKIQKGEVILINHDFPESLILEENYLMSDTYTKGTQEISLETDQYFVMGDNRNSSLDSRVFGPIERKMIVGKTWLRAWPFSEITHFTSPQYSY